MTWVLISPPRQRVSPCPQSTSPHPATQPTKNNVSSHVPGSTLGLTIRDVVWRQCGQYGPSYLDAPPSDPVIVSGPLPLPASLTYMISQGVNPPGISLAAPTPSSSGPKRTRQPTREGRRRYDPVKSAGKKVDSKNDWNQTLVRFQVQLDTLYNVQNGQPSGWLVPEMALAEVNTLVKEDLKRSVSGFFTAFLLVILLICQPGNSLSETQRPEKESALGMWRITSEAC